jgi:hypothetical protein
MKKILFFTLISLSFSSFAEYRVYQYLVKNTVYNQDQANGQIITSTLNPVAYKAYHGGSLVKVDLLRTWICPGHTAKKDICPSPYTDKSVVNL